MSTGNGYRDGHDAATQNRPVPQSNNWYVQQNINDGYKAGSKK